MIQCDDRPGLLAEVANVIARHDHNITVRGSHACWGVGWGLLGLLGHADWWVGAGATTTPSRQAAHRPRGPVALLPAPRALPLQAYSGSADIDAGLFVMEYELEGGLKFD